jgi:hypothetical protein
VQISIHIFNLHLQSGRDKSTRFNGKSTWKICTIDRRTSSQKKLNNNRATTKLTRTNRKKIFFSEINKFVLLVMRYSLDEFRRIFVEENTLIESNEPIIPIWETKKTEKSIDKNRIMISLPTITRITLE